MAEETPIGPSGAPCSWKELKIISDTKAKVKQAWDDLMVIVDKISEAKKDFTWGKLGAAALAVGDAVLAAVLSQAAAMAQTVAAQAAAALGALIAKAMEALFKYILYMVSFGPSFLTSIMKKPIDRAILYSNKENSYLSACRGNIGRIIAVMEEMFSMELLPDYTQKMSESKEYLTKCLEALSSLTAELDSSSYFRKPVYDRAMSDLKSASEAIRVNTPLSTALSNQIENKKQDYAVKTDEKKNEQIVNASNKRNEAIKKASSDFSRRILEIIAYYSPTVISSYGLLLKNNGFTVDDAGARDYINSLVSMTKKDRSTEATKNNIISSGYSTKSTIKSTLGVNFSNDLAGCANAINDAENTKVASVSNANQAYDRSIDSIEIKFEAVKANDTARSIYDTFKGDGLNDVLKEAYPDRWAINVKFLQEEFTSLARNTLTAFTFYKKRQACTKGAAFSVAQLKKAFDMIARFMSKNVSGNLASGTSSFIKTTKDTGLQPAMDILSKHIAEAGTSSAAAKTKVALDAMLVWTRLSTSELALNSFITQSLVDTINISKIFEQTEALIDEKVGKIAAIPDWDGGTARITTNPLEPAPASAGWIYSDRKRPAPNSPYIKLTKDIATMSVSAPFNLVAGGASKEALRKKIYSVNETINKLIQHNQLSVSVLEGLEIQENPYVDQAMAQLDKYGMDMLMDMFEAAAFASMAASIISGKASYAMAQFQCAKKLQANANTPEVKAVADTAAAENAAKMDDGNSANSNAVTNAEADATYASKQPSIGSPEYFTMFYRDPEPETVEGLY